MQQTRIGETILFVGDNGSFLSKLQAEFPKAVVMASARKLSELAASSNQLSDRHSIIMFETDASDSDIEALTRLGAGREGPPVFVALIDEDVPIGRARKLFEAGAEVLPNGSGQDGLTRSLSRFVSGGARAQQAPAAPPDGAVYSIVSTRGGSGATTVAVNLAVALAEGMPKDKGAPTQPNRVLLLDFDIQFGNAGTYVDVEDNGGFTDLLAAEVAPSPDRVLGAVQDTGLGFDILTAPAIFVPLTAMTGELAERILDTARRNHAHVVVDLPRAALDWVEPVVGVTDRLLLVSDGSVPCIRQAKRLLDLYHEMHPALAIELVMNRERKPMFKSAQVDEARQLLQIEIGDWLAQDVAGERRAIDLGRPSACRQSRNRKNFRRLAQRLLAARRTAGINLVK
ncbi:MAG: hypothetical protein KDK10_07485 [Maritimibacter sp.]|nr:hypothetical protein [Maritimibacter sp.]